MKMESLGDIALYFQHGKNMFTDSIYVNGELRKEWMITNVEPYIKGKIREVIFEDMGDDVWKASIREMADES